MFAVADSCKTLTGTGGLKSPAGSVVTITLLDISDSPNELYAFIAIVYEVEGTSS